MSFTNYPEPFAYHVLSCSLNTFKKAYALLTPTEQAKAMQQAEASWELEEKVLRSEKAQLFEVTPEEVEDSFNEIWKQYKDEKSFLIDLKSNELTIEILKDALHRGLTFHKVMSDVEKSAPIVEEKLAEIFYNKNKDKFIVPEQREVRHIFIGIDRENYEASEKEALLKIKDIAAKIGDNTEEFVKQVGLHSECPSAANEGKLGCFQKGKLYKQIDDVLFSMKENEISEVVKSDIAYHILWCEKIRTEKRPEYDDVKEGILKHLNKQTALKYKSEWIEKLEN